jgi:hypothetical protein
MAATKRTPLTRDDLESLYESEDPEWGGYGYLAEREYGLRTAKGREVVEYADKAIVDHANAQGWTREDLFRWADSRTGRHYGEEFFRQGLDRLPSTVAARCADWNLMDLPRR